MNTQPRTEKTREHSAHAVTPFRGGCLTGWNFDHGYLCEPEAMELIYSMPIILFKPVEAKKKSGKGIYVCPLYMYPIRTGTRERPSFMLAVDLKSGQVEPDHWIKRGTALLLTLEA